MPSLTSKSNPADQVIAARRAHWRDETRSKLHASAAGNYLRDMVYGANDGIVTTFAVVAGVAGAELGLNVVLILGFDGLGTRGPPDAPANGSLTGGGVAGCIGTDGRAGAGWLAEGWGDLSNIYYDELLAVSL